MSNLPPGPKGLPIFGSLLDIQGQPYIKVTDIARKYGDVCMLRLGSAPVVVISHPEIAREAFLRHELSDRWISQALNILSGNRSDLVFARYDDQWRRLQRYANRNVLSYRRISTVREYYVEPMIDLISDSVGETADSGELLEPTEYFQHMAARTMVDILFGIGGFSDSEILMSSIEKILNVITWGFGRATISSPVHYFGRYSRLLGHPLNRIAEVVQEMSALNFDSIMSSPLFDLDSPTCLVEVMLSDMREGIIDMSDARALVTDLLIAGMDTTAQTFSWLVLMMANNMEAQDRLHAELQSAQPVDPAKGLGMDDMPNLPFTHSTLMENMRRNPVVPFAVPHRASRTCELAGYTIPEDAMVLPNIYGMHHDERFWDDPYRFDPERFMPLPDASPSPNMENVAFMPFGTGRRACPGQNLAMAVLWLETVKLFANYRFEPPPGVKQIPMRYKTQLATGSAPFKVRVTRR